MTPDWFHLMPYGYAPGNYMNRCFTCEKMFDNLDKRAVRCRPCAEGLYAAKQAKNDPAQVSGWAGSGMRRRIE